MTVPEHPEGRREPPAPGGPVDPPPAPGAVRLRLLAALLALAAGMAAVLVAILMVRGVV